MKREFLNDFRNLKSIKLLAFESAIVSIYFGLLFLQLPNNQNGIQNRLGAIFSILLQSNYGYIFSIVYLYHLHLSLAFREIKNRYYSFVSFYCAKQLGKHL